MTNKNHNETMRAVLLTAHGGLDKLAYRTDAPKPVAARGEVLIRVRACGLNNTDVNTRTAWYSKSTTAATTGQALDDARAEDAAWGGSPIRFPRIQGGDVAGVVAAVGEGVDAALVGQRVLVDPCFRDLQKPEDINLYSYLGSEHDGGFADYTVAPAQQVHPINTPLSDAECATFAIAYLTAENMLNRVQVKKGDAVLVTGASGGVGSALLQLAKRRGAKVIGICSGDKIDQLQPLGADALLAREEVAADSAALTNGIAAVCKQPTVTVVADVVGGGQFAAVVGCIARGGRYVTSGAIAGPVVDLDLRTLYLRDLTLAGATYSPPGTFADLVGYIERGEIRPLLAAQYPLAQLHMAQQAFIDKKHIGNIVVCTEDDD